MDALKNDSDFIDLRKRLAGKVFNLTSAYDAAVSHYLLNEDFPDFWDESLKKAQDLRYGENAHQKAALYLHSGRKGVFSDMEFLGGKDLSYNNIRDLDLAWKTVCSFGLPSACELPLGHADSKRVLPDIAFVQSACCVAVKHNTPCGIALGDTIEEAFAKTYLCDPVSIFGGIVACNVKVTVELAKKLNELFLEIVIAPDYDDKALEILRQKKNLRIIKAVSAPKDALESVSVDGGRLVQETNRRLLEKWDVVTKTALDPLFIPDLLFGVRAVNWVKSNAIVVVKDRAAIGIGGGETNRIWAAELALSRAAKNISASANASDSPSHPFSNAEPARVMASDAFFPFPDVVETAAAAGIKAIIQSGGSNNDKLSIDACNNLGISMVFTGTRYFKH
jgi:phosphoribosylaminoimidazolecarboxamide formyltransferase/IMP cyclohydrolase